MNLDDSIDAKITQFSEIENKMSGKIVHLEKILETTLSMHTKMQDNLKMWLQQRENDSKQVKRPKIIEQVTLPHNLKILIPPVITKDEKNKLENNICVTTVKENKVNNNNNLFANQVKEAIKIELIGKDSSIKYYYKLNSQVKFENFYEFLTSELRTIELLYIIDSTVIPPEGLNEKVKEKHKFKVRDILINRIDKAYHSRILHIKDPNEILSKLKEFERCKVNLTSVTARKQLYTIQYDPKRETAIKFLDKFEEIISNYENIPGSAPLADDEKRDALFNAIMNQIPEVQSVEFMTKNQTGKSLNFDMLKMFIIQAEANRLQAANKNHPGSNSTTVGSVQFTNSAKTKWVNERCYECDDYGHMKNECLRKGQGVRKCYECQRFTTHKAAMCPQRLSKQGGRGRGIAGKRHFQTNNKSNFSRFNSKRNFKTKFNSKNKNLNSFKQSHDNSKQLSKKNNDSQTKKQFVQRNDSLQTQQRQTRTGTSDEPKINFADHQNNKSSKFNQNMSQQTSVSMVDSISTLNTRTASPVYLYDLSKSNRDNNKNHKYISFVVDSGATEHITHSKNIFDR